MKRSKHIKKSLCGLIFIALLIFTGNALAWQTVRVAVYKSPDFVRIKGKAIKIGVITKDGVNGEVVGVNPKEVVISLKNKYLYIKGVSSRFTAVTVTCPGKLLRINGVRYHAPLEIVSDTRNGGHIVVVSEINLESYLMGVVSSEVPTSWPIEALKAQSVAARTFAVRQMLDSQSKFYHLESTVSD